MSHAETIEVAYQNSRSELLKYATAITGDRQQAEDILQDAWLRCTAAAVSEQIREPIRFLFRVVRNLALDYRRRRTYEKRYINVEVDDRVIDNARAYEASPEDAAISTQEIRMLMTALSELDHRTRMAVEMHRFENAKLREIAETLGVSLTMAHNLVAEGLRHCRNHLRRAD